MAVVKRRHQLDRFGQQHAIAEHVTRHIADASNRDGILLHIDAHFQKVPLHRNPAAFRGNAHRFMVIPNRTAAGKSIAQPKSAFVGNGVGGVGKCRRALVCGNHEIRVFAIMDDDACGMHNLVLHDIVGDRQ